MVISFLPAVSFLLCPKSVLICPVLGFTSLISSAFLKLILPHLKHEKKTPNFPLSISRLEPHRHFNPSSSSSLWSVHTGNPCLFFIVACFWQKGHLSILLWPYFFGINIEKNRIALV